MPSDIPGFFFDKDKQRYFRIQKNHVLPAGAAHTHASVKALREAEEKEKRRIKWEKRISSGKVTRSPLARSSDVLDVRLGRIRTSQAQRTVTEVFARNLTCRPVVSSAVHHNLPGREHQQRAFDIDDDGRLFVSNGSGAYLMGARPADEFYPGNYGYVIPQASEPWNSSSSFGRRVDMVHRLVATIDGLFMSSSGGLHITMGSYWYDPRTLPIILGQNVDMPDTDQIWDIAASQTSSGPMFAMATDNGITLASIDPAERFAHISICDGFKHREQLNVKFKERDIVMSGERSGRVNLTDIRSPHSTVTRLHHSSAVISTSSTKNQSEILVQGFSTMSIYDLRYNKARPPPARVTSRKLNLSKPCLDIPMTIDRQSDQYVSGGQKVAYSSDLDLIVAASSRVHVQHRGTYRVTLYSAKTGRMVPSALNDHVFHDLVRRVAMKRIRDGPESILTLSGTELLEWTVHGEYDDSFEKMDDAAKERVEDEMERKANETLGRVGIVQEWKRGNLGSR